jgi:hypothetical protein
MALIFALVLRSSQTLADRHVGTLIELELKCHVRRQPIYACRIHTKSYENRPNDSKFITGEDNHMDTNVKYEKGVRHYLKKKAV